MKKYLIITLFLLWQGAHAQVEQVITVSINSAERPQGKTQKLVLNFGSNIGLASGMKGKAIGLYSEQNPERFAYLADVEINQVEQTRATATAQLYDTISIRTEDLIELVVPIPNRYRGVFFKLIQYGIFLVDETPEQNYFYTRLKVINKESPEMEDSLVNELIKAIKTSQKIRQNNRPDSIIASGIYKGRRYYDLLYNPNKTDILRWLSYLPTDLKTFMGKTFYAPLNYRYWVDDGAWLSWESLKQTLMQAKEEKEFDRLYQEFKTYFTTERYEEWSDYVSNNLDEMENQYALDLILLNERLAQRANLPIIEAWANFNRAQVYTKMLEYDKAIFYYRRCKDIFLKNNNEFYASYALNNTAHIFKQKDQLDSAKYYYEKSLEIKRRSGKEERILKSMLPTLYGLYLVEIQLNPKNPQSIKKAISYLEERVQIYEKLKDESALVSEYNDIAQAYAQYLKDEKTAIQYCNRAHEIRLKAVKNKTVSPQQQEYLLANHYSDLAKIYTTLEKYDKVTQMHQSRYEIYLTNQDTENQASALWDMAYHQTENLKDYAAALKTYQEVLRLYNQMGSQANAATILRNMAIANENLSQFGEAEKLYEQAYVLREKLAAQNPLDKGLQEALAKSYKDMATRKAAKGLYNQAIELHDKRIRIFERYNDFASMADALWDKAYIIGSNLSRYKEAIEIYEKVFKIYQDLNDNYNSSTILSNIAQNYWSLGDYSKAIEFHQKAIQLAEKSSNRLRIAKSYASLAELYKETGDAMRGLQALQKAIDTYEQLNESGLLCDSYKTMAGFYKDARDWPTAFSLYQKALQIAEKLGDNQRISDVYFDMADCYYEYKKYDEAEKYYHKSIQTAKLAGIVTNEIYSLANLGLIESLRNNYKKAEEYYRTGLERAKTVDDAKITAYCQKQMAGLLMNTSQYNEAEKIYFQVLDYYTKVGDKSSQASTLISLASLASIKGDYTQYQKYVEQALQIATQTNDRNQIANCNAHLAELYMIRGEFEKALAMHENSLKTFSEVDNAWGVASALISIGNVYNLKGDYVKSLMYYQKSDSIYAALNSLHSRATTSNNMGTIYYWQGDYEKAMPMFDRAISILDSLGVKDAFYNTLFTNKGEVYEAQKQYQKAEEMLNISLKGAQQIQDRTEIASASLALGKIKRYQKDYAAAEKLFLTAYNTYKELQIKTIFAFAASELGINYYEKNDIPNAQKYLSEAADTARKYALSRYLWETLYYQALIAKSQNKIEEAKKLLIEAIAALEDIQSKMTGGEAAKKIFASDEKKIKIYQTLVDVLIAKGEVELGLSYLERSNSEDLRNKFKSLNIKFSDNQKNEALEKERNLKRKLDNLEAELQKEKSSPKANEAKIVELQKIRTVAESEYVQFVNITLSKQPDLKQHLSKSVNPLEMRNERKKNKIPSNLAVLSYLPGDENLYIFLATSDTVIAKVIAVGREELWKYIRFVHNIGSRSFKGIATDPLRVARGKNPSPPPLRFNTEKTEFKIISEKLYDYLISPVENEILQKEILAIIPSGPFHFLPFQMLGKSLPSGKFDYLIEHHTIFYTNSLEMLHNTSQKHDEFKIIAFANADNTLPATEKEVEEIRKLYPKSQVFVRNEATENKVKSLIEGNNVLHLATHGNLDYYEFESSFLTLAEGGEQEDGKLTISEVWGLEGLHNYKLVTLSACQTAVSEGAHEGWPVSPATSFLDAGAPTVVASLWSVDDAATALLMRYFYQNLRTMTKVEALRHAQIQLAADEKYSHPYYWAPFVLIGDWR